MKALVVLSGGQDSTTCLFLALQHYSDVHCLTFNYGQTHAREIGAAHDVIRVARCFYPNAKITHEVVEMPRVLKGTSPLVSTSTPLEQYEDWNALPGGIEKTFVPMRNQLFLTIAANRAVVEQANAVYTGVSMEDYGGYPDCREGFIKSLQDTINTSLEGVFRISIITPLMYLDKAGTVRQAKVLPGCWKALAYSHTAYDGAYPPVGKDHATLLRAKGFAEAGEPDPLIVRAFCEGLMLLPQTPNYDKVDRNLYGTATPEATAE